MRLTQIISKMVHAIKFNAEIEIPAELIGKVSSTVTFSVLGNDPVEMEEVKDPTEEAETPQISPNAPEAVQPPQEETQEPKKPRKRKEVKSEVAEETPEPQPQAQADPEPPADPEPQADPDPEPQADPEPPQAPKLTRSDIKLAVLNKPQFKPGTQGRAAIQSWLREKAEARGASKYNTDTLPEDLFEEFIEFVKSFDNE